MGAPLVLGDTQVKKRQNGISAGPLLDRGLFVNYVSMLGYLVGRSNANQC